MLDYLGWILFVLMVIWYFKSMRFSHVKRLNLTSYVVYLLLSEELRTNHQQNFMEWISTSSFQDAMSLSHQAGAVIENMADNLATGEDSSILGAHGLLWQFKQGKSQD